MNGEERDDKTKGPARMQKGREKNSLGELCSRRHIRGGKQRRKACQGGYRQRQGTRRGKPAEERSRPEKAAKTKKEEESSFLLGI